MHHTSREGIEGQGPCVIQYLLVIAIAGLTSALMVSAEADYGEGYGPVAVPVFKTELRGVSCADGSTPSLLRHFSVTVLVRRISPEC